MEVIITKKNITSNQELLEIDQEILDMIIGIFKNLKKEKESYKV